MVRLVLVMCDHTDAHVVSDNRSPQYLKVVVQSKETTGITLHM